MLTHEHGRASSLRARGLLLLRGALDQDVHDLLTAFLLRKVQRGVALRVLQVRIGTVREKQLHPVRRSGLRGSVEHCPTVFILRVHVSPVRQKELRYLPMPPERFKLM